MFTLLILINHLLFSFSFFFFNDTATTEIYTLSLHDALPISIAPDWCCRRIASTRRLPQSRSEEHTSELQSRENLVCRLLLEKKKKIKINMIIYKKTKMTEIIKKYILRQARSLYATNSCLLLCWKSCSLK